MTRIESLHVRAFRGIVDARLPFDGGSIVLGGANGTGKTGFVDALEFLYTGSVSTLAGTQGLNLRHHGPHVSARAAETELTADFDDPPLSLTRRLSGSVQVPPALARHLEQGRRLSFILRRSQVQQFIHAKPADRYRSLADLIGVEALDSTQVALKRARDSLEHALTETRTQLAQSDRQIADLADQDFLQAALLFDLNQALADSAFADFRLDSWAEVEAVREQLLARAMAARPDPAGEARSRLAGELERGIGEQRLREALAAYMELMPSRQTGADRAHLLGLLQVLRGGRDYLRHAESHECPLCRQRIDAHALLARLVNRIAELEEVNLYQQRLDRARRDLQAALEETRNRLRTVERAQVEAQAQGRETSSLGNALAMLQESMDVRTSVESMESLDRVEDALEQWRDWSRATLAGLTAPTEAREGHPPYSLNALLTLLDNVAVRRAQAEREDRERERLEGDRERLLLEVRRKERALALADATYSTFNRVKNGEIQRIYDDLRSDLSYFYDVLHPGEGHGGLVIAMDPHKRGSSDLKMRFYGREAEDPRAFGSEGHLDSLGVCIFLAFVKRFNGDWPLLVLDDVVTSVDAAHKRRLATLLFREFGERQLFITTQDSRWFADLQRAEQETGRADTTQNLVIESWSLEEGPRLRAMASQLQPAR